MSEKEFRKNVVGKNTLSNLTLVFKIVFDLIPQVLLVYLISFLITKNIKIEKLKYIFSLMCLSFLLKGMFSYFYLKSNDYLKKSPVYGHFRKTAA